MTIIDIQSKAEQISITMSISKVWKGLMSEFLSTLLLVFFGCLSCVPTEASTPNPYVFASLAFGLIVMINIQVFGHISGAFMNPFIAIIAVLWGKISAFLGVAYIVAECAGAILGYGLLMTVAPIDVAAHGICTTEPNNVSELQAMGVEILMSAGLSLITCAIWDPVNARNTDGVPLKFGLTILGLSLVGAPLSGGSMNPARSLGPAIWANHWESHWVYWVGPLVGGIVPAVLYKYLLLEKPESKTNGAEIPQSS